MNRNDFQVILESKRDWVIVWFSATWCDPCKKVEPLITPWIERLPDKIAVLHLDYDTNCDVYAALRGKKQVRGIPVLLGYKPGNTTLYADVSCSGILEKDVDAFFRTIQYLKLE